MSRDQADRRNHHDRVEVYIGNHISHRGFGTEIMVRLESKERKYRKRERDVDKKEWRDAGTVQLRLDVERTWVDGHHISP